MNRALLKEQESCVQELKELGDKIKVRDSQKEKDAEEICGLQRMLAEVESKNKRLTDLLNSQICN